MASFTEPPGMPQRPWYVTLALIVAFLFAIEASLDGCARIQQYQGAETKLVSDEVRDPVVRQQIRERSEAVLGSLYAHKKVLYPLHIALFLVSAAMAVFAIRMLFRRSFGRSLLIQLLSVQAALLIGRHALERDTREAVYDLMRASAQGPPIAARLRVFTLEDEVKLLRIATPIFLGLRTFASLLIIAALLNRKARLSLDAPDTDESTSEFE